MESDGGPTRAIVRDPRVRRPGASRRALLSIAVAVGTLSVAAGGLLALRGRHAGYRLTSFETATVRRGPIVNAAEYLGTVDFTLSRTLLAPAACEVISVAARPGDDVRAGDTLAVLRSEQIASAIADDERALRRAERARERLVLDRRSAALRERLDVELASSRAERAAAAAAAARELNATGIASRAQLEEAESARIDAEASLEEARSRAEVGGPLHLLALAAAEEDIHEAETRLARDRALADGLAVRSPFDGTVLQLAAQPGRSLPAGAAVATVVDRSSPVVRFRVPERHAASLVAGRDVGIRIGDGLVPGVVVSLDAEASESSVAVTAALCADPPAGLRAGSSVAVEVVLGASADALLLPRGPFLSGGNESWVYVVDGDRAVKTPMSIGMRNASEVEITRGVAEGDRVIVSSYEEFLSRETVSIDTPGGTER